MRPRRGVDRPEAVRDALALSQLRDVPEPTIDALLQGSRRIQVSAGSTVRRAGQAGPHLELLLDGFIRIFVTAEDGRTLTVRYVRRGELAGAASLFTPRFSMPGSIQAVLDSDILAFDPGVVRALADRDVRVARALLAELSERVVTFVGEIPGSAFTTVRQRVARHLLDLGTDEQQHGRQLFARVSQQALADSVGSVREVVVRVLRELRAEGVVRTSRDGILILAPDRLLVELAPPPAAATDNWNPGS